MVRVDKDFVEFDFFRRDAEDVCIVGDFNNWRPGELRMARDGRGYWHAKLRLRPGEFHFRYLADGQWYTDYAAFGVEQGPYGLDSIVCVGGAA